MSLRCVVDQEDPRNEPNHSESAKQVEAERPAAAILQGAEPAGYRQGYHCAYVRAWGGIIISE